MPDRARGPPRRAGGAARSARGPVRAPRHAGDQLITNGSRISPTAPARRSTRSRETLGPSFPSGHSSTAAAFYAARRCSSARTERPRARAARRRVPSRSRSPSPRAACCSTCTGCPTWSPVSRSAGRGSRSARSRSAAGCCASREPAEQASAHRGAAPEARRPRRSRQGVVLGRPGEARGMNTTSPHATPKPSPTRPLFEGLARAGYVARGLIYVVIGVLADPPRAGRQRSAGEPAGRAAADRAPAASGTPCCADRHRPRRLRALAVSRRPSSAHAGRRRAQHARSHRGGRQRRRLCGVLRASRSSVLRGTGGNSSAQTQARRRPASSHWPAGRELVAAAGLLFIVIAAYQAYLGLSRKFLKDSKIGQMSAGVRKAFTADRRRRAASPAPSRSG